MTGQSVRLPGCANIVHVDPVPTPALRGTPPRKCLSGTARGVCAAFGQRGRACPI